MPSVIRRRRVGCLSEIGAICRVMGIASAAKHPDLFVTLWIASIRSQ
jgi:hypothetical protein